MEVHCVLKLLACLLLCGVQEWGVQVKPSRMERDVEGCCKSLIQSRQAFLSLRKRESRENAGPSAQVRGDRGDAARPK